MDLRKKIKNFFIPSLQNQLRPFSLRFGTLFFVVVLSIAIEIAFYAYVNVAFKRNDLLSNIISSIQTTVAEALPQVIIEQTNTARQASGAQPLALNSRLALAARLKAEDLASKGYFSHQSPDGSMPWDWMKKANYDYSYAGENLAVNFFDASDLMDAWLNSPSHRANILSQDYTEIGIAAVRGVYAGRETVFVVQMFGTPGRPEPLLKNFAAGTTSINKTTPLPVSPRPLSTLVSATGTFATTTMAIGGTSSFEAKTVSATGVSGTIPAVKLVGASLSQRYLVSPRHLARDAYIVLLIYMFLCLAIPMFMIYYRHASANRWLRFYEIFILFKQPIISAVVTFICVSAVMVANYAWSKQGTNIYQAAISVVENSAP